MLLNRSVFFRLAIVSLAFMAFSCKAFVSSTGGDKAFQLGEYSGAAAIYSKQLSKEKNKYLKGEISFKIGECYRLINNPSKAASAYSKAARAKYDNPLTEIYWAQNLLKQGKVAEANEIYTNYLIKYPKEPRVHVGLSSCKMAMEEVKPTRYTVSEIKEFKSKYSDYTPSFGGTENDVVYFSSMRHVGKTKGLSKITGQGSSNIYSTRPNSKGKWMVPEPLSESINTPFDEGATSLTADGSTMYFTRCKYDKTKILGGEILMCRRVGGQWSEPAVVPIGGDSLLFAHPAISPDNLTLYFVSNIEGSVGGKDIWKVERTTASGDWSTPINMGEKINTIGDEMFPTVRDDGTLYFSSDGHAGYGGLDIFSASIVKNEETEVKTLVIRNVGRPINSEADDFSMVFKSGKLEGMFTSARNNLKGFDKIYQFSYRQIVYSLKGVVFNEKTKQPIPNTYVKIVATDGTIEKLEILPDGSFSKKLKPNTEYVFLAAAPGFLNQKVRFSTVGLDDDKEFGFELAMISKSRPVVLENISFAAGGSAITTKMEESLDRLFVMLQDNPQVRIEISSHTDAEGDDSQNIVISQKRSEAIMNHLTKKGITVDRIASKGYGESQPLIVDSNTAKQHRFLNKGDVLTPEYINKLSGKNKEIASKLNQRTEFKVISE